MTYHTGVLIAQDSVALWVTGMAQVAAMVLVGVISVVVSLILAKRNEKQRVLIAKRKAKILWRRLVKDLERRVLDLEQDDRDCPYCPPHKRPYPKKEDDHE